MNELLTLPNLPANDDFDLKDILRSIKDQAKDADVMSERIATLEEKFGSHEKIAETLTVTAQKAVQMQTMLSSEFVKLLQSNSEVKATINEMINKADRDYVKTAIKRFGFLAYSIIIFISGVVITAVINHYFK